MATNSKEVAFALSFLKYAGVKLPESNVYLILAVIAWLRQESGGIARVIGNNPFNIRRSPYAVGYRTIKGNGKFAIFASLDAGARATVSLLKSDGPNGWRGYGSIIRALTRGAGSGAKAQQDQAIDFLTAVAISRWDAAHYGSMVGQDISTYDGRNNKLIKVWMGLLGQKVTLPAPNPKKPKPKPPRPRQPDDKLYITPRSEYIQPYAAFHFYRERQTKDEPLTGGVPGLL